MSDTTYEDARDLYNAGKTYQEVSEILSIPLRSARGYMNGFGRKQLWSREKTARLEELWGEGCSTRAIALELGTTRNAVIGKIDRMGLSRKGEPKSALLPEYRPGVCQFIHGDPPAHSYCGAEVKLGSSYCEEHHAVCYRKTDTEPKSGKRPVTNWGPLQSGLVA